MHYPTDKTRRSRKRQPGTLADLLQVLWNALKEAEEVLNTSAGDPELVLKAAHCISQCAGQYHKMLEGYTFEERLAALEAQMTKEAA